MLRDSNPRPCSEKHFSFSIGLVDFGVEDRGLRQDEKMRSFVLGMPLSKSENLQTRHPRKLSMVGGDERHSMEAGGGSDPEIVRSDERSRGRKLPVNFPVFPGNFHGPGKNRVGLAQPAPRRVRRCRCPASQFTRHGECDEHRVACMRLQKCIRLFGMLPFRLPLHRDHKTGIEDYFLGSSGGRSVAAAFSSESRYEVEIPLPPRRRYSRIIRPVGAALGNSTLRTTSENDSPGFLHARNLS